MVSIEDLKYAIADREAVMLRKFGEGDIIRRELPMHGNLPSKDVVSIITGPRRCGKSIYAFQVSEGRKFGYVNFEDERLNVRLEELNKVVEAVYSLKGEVELFIFDEIQNIPGWERFVSRLSPSHRIIVTGSNARLMSRELATFLTGRHIDHELLPFSFREYLLHRGSSRTGKSITTKEKAGLYNLLVSYMEEGGFPLSYTLGRSFLSELYNDMLEKDVIARHKVRYGSKLKELARYLISNFSSEISYNKLRNSLELGGFHTVSNWVGYLCDAYLVFTLERFSFKLKEQYRAPKKVYCIDTGMINAMAFKTSKDIGKIMENLVAVELLRRRSYGKNRIDIYYWRDHADKEVDFVIKKGEMVAELMQVTHASSMDEINDREIKGLVKASAELGCKNLTIVSWDVSEEIQVGRVTIKIVPLLNWLLPTA